MNNRMIQTRPIRADDIVDLEAAQAPYRVRFHNQINGPRIERGGCPVIGQSLTFGTSGGNGTITRTDAAWNERAGGNWKVGSGLLVATGVDAGVGSLVLGFSNNGRTITVNGAMMGNAFTAGTRTVDVRPVFNSNAGANLVACALNFGDRVLDIGTGSGADTGVYVVDDLGWSRAPGLDTPQGLRAGLHVFVEHLEIGAAVTPVFVLTEGRLGETLVWDSVLTASGGGGGGGGGGPTIWKERCVAAIAFQGTESIRRGGRDVQGVELTFADDNPDTITRSTGSWIDDGFDVMTPIMTDGASNNANNVVGIITAATATKITVQGFGNPDIGFVSETTSNAIVVPTVDGLRPLFAGNRVLDTNNADAKKRGIYVVGPGAAGWQRAPDADSSEDFQAGMIVPVYPGAEYAPGDTTAGLWRLTNNSVTLGATNLNFTNESFRLAGREFNLRTVSDGDVLKWNAGQNSFVAGSAGGGNAYAPPFKQPCDAFTADGSIRRGGIPVSGVQLTFTDANPDTIERASGSWIDDGFGANSAIIVKNATNAANNKFFIVTNATATTLTVTKPNGSNADLVNETTNAASVSPTVDGENGLGVGARVLDVDNTTATKRGIYVVAAGAGGWTRAPDADSSAELPPGTLVQVQYPQSLWRLNNSYVNLGITELEWVKQSSEVDGRVFSLDGPVNGNPSDGDAILWDQATSRFVAGAAGGFNGVMNVALQMTGFLANAASATDLVITKNNGNIHYVSGNTAIETLTPASDWQDGSVIILMFAAAGCQVKSNQALMGDKANIVLVGGVDFWSTSSASDMLVLVKKQSSWYEILRSQKSTGFSEIASANTITLPVDADTITITGNGTINLISTEKIPAGKIITLWFRDGGGTLKHAQANNGNDIGIYLSGSADLVWGSGDTVTLRQFSTKWIEIGRSVA